MLNATMTLELENTITKLKKNLINPIQAVMPYHILVPISPYHGIDQIDMRL